MPYKLKIGVIQKMDNFLFFAGEVIVKTNDLIALPQ
jgi:hypothetical protein